MVTKRRIVFKRHSLFTFWVKCYVLFVLTVTSLVEDNLPSPTKYLRCAVKDAKKKNEDIVKIESMLLMFYSSWIFLKSFNVP